MNPAAKSIKIRITHNTRLQVDLAKLRGWLTENATGDFTGFYVNVRMLPDSRWEERVMEYIMKDQKHN